MYLHIPRFSTHAHTATLMETHVPKMLLLLTVPGQTKVHQHLNGLKDFCKSNHYFFFNDFNKRLQSIGVTVVFQKAQPDFCYFPVHIMDLGFP